jgi:RND family efflux transporter MFP subunit
MEFLGGIKMKKVIVAVIILAVAAVGIWRVSEILKARREAAQEVEKPLTAVETQEVKRGNIREELFLVGNIVAASEVSVFPKVSGKVVQIPVDEGSSVRKGDVIAKIEDKELRLQVKQAEAAVEAAAVGLDQAKSLSEVRIRSQVAQAQAGFASAEAALKQVQDLAKTRTLSQMEQAEAGLVALKANLKKIKDGARSEEKRQVEATVQQAKAGLDNAKADLERIENLYAEGAVSKQTLDATRTGATVAEAQYEAASQQLKLVETGAREEDILAMESQVKQAEAGLELARSAMETRSWEKDIEMAQAGYSQAKAALDSARALEKAKSWEAEIVAAETGLKQAEVALDLAREMLNNATITAPISGIVSKRFLDEGGMAAPAVPLFTIVDMDKVKAVVDVTEANLAKVSHKSEAFISVEAFPEQISGEVTLVSPTLKSISRTASVEITIDNTSHKLKPGMFAKVTLPVETHEDAVLVRRSAVIEDRASGGKHVFVINNGISIKREVETGLVKSDLIEVLSGVRPGEKVVVSGQHYLEDGERVKVID